jgi:hypothetical protein
MESYYLAYLTDDGKYLYPGFRSSVNPNEPRGPRRTEALWPEPRSATTWVCTAGHHLLRVTRSGRDVTVLGCLYSYRVGRQGQGGGFEPNIGAGFRPDAGISALRIGLQAPENEESALPAQEGTSRAPFENIFGGWRVTRHEGGYLVKARWADSMRDKAECASRAEGSPENHRFTPNQEYPDRLSPPCLPHPAGRPSPLGVP